jgi:hypothetical protein
MKYKSIREEELKQKLELIGLNNLIPLKLEILILLFFQSKIICLVEQSL